LRIYTLERSKYLNRNISGTARLLAAIVVMSGTLAGCDAGVGGIGIGANTVQGSGNVVTEQRPVSGVTEVAFTMSGSLTIEQNGNEALTLEGEDNILPLITTEVQGSRLTIGTKPNTSFTNTKPLNFRLSVKDLAYIGSTGSGEITMDSLKGKEVRMEASGSGATKIGGIAADSITASITGSGGVTTSGKVEKQDVTISGSGKYDGSQLESKSATVVTSGSGDATVRVSDSLNATVNGSGSVRYIGSPTVTKKVSGSGAITQIGSK